MTSITKMHGIMNIKKIEVSSVCVATR